MDGGVSPELPDRCSDQIPKTTDPIPEARTLAFSALFQWPAKPHLTANAFDRRFHRIDVQMVNGSAVLDLNIR